MQLLLPVLRADFAALETHEHRDEPPLDLPLGVCGGAFDRTVRPPELDGWRLHSTQPGGVQLWPGDHFYLHVLAPELIAAIVKDLGPVPSPDRAMAA
jgi:medium-chain acyl-[acyl-carrier-protein] hydrolase